MCARYGSTRVPGTVIRNVIFHISHFTCTRTNKIIENIYFHTAAYIYFGLCIRHQSALLPSVRHHSCRHFFLRVHTNTLGVALQSAGALAWHGTAPCRFSAEATHTLQCTHTEARAACVTDFSFEHGGTSPSFSLLREQEHARRTVSTPMVRACLVQTSAAVSVLSLLLALGIFYFLVLR